MLELGKNEVDRRICMTTYRVIVCATDFSDPARAAFREAVHLARISGAVLHLVHVFRYPMLEYPQYGVTIPDQILQDARAEAEALLAQQAQQAEQDDCEVTVHLVDGIPADAIHAVVAETGADLLVMGTRAHHGLAHLVLGSVAERTARRVPCSVLIVKGPPPDASPGS
jgi:nucleotide-binding universal stress UspA family protein